jgi:hypothetical protein
MRTWSRNHPSSNDGSRNRHHLPSSVSWGGIVLALAQLIELGEPAKTSFRYNALTLARGFFCGQKRMVEI